ncbi:MAG: methyltransferase MtaB domain-containing protein [Fimbriimonas sp.]|nr:methyltransferase MtaB domain-containing protein [Fimbriimonas sp.]
MSEFTKLAIEDPANLIFGFAPKPLVTRRGMRIGGGVVYPEINFTLPTMFVNGATMPEVCRQYREMIDGVLKRACELSVPGLVVEFETLPPMTENPDWGMEVTNILLDAMHEAHAKEGLKSVLRMTPNDTREMVRPPVMRSGELWENMLELFDRSAAAGAELLSIESVGGKEVHDEALQSCDVGQVIFALCVMGVRDMRFLWPHIREIADRHNVHAAGDTACGFANTAMVLAEQKLIPRVFAAVVRSISAVRSLAAYECGAVGPGKDCGYENVILKAITGYPMAMEGKSAACAHLSPVGNVAAAACDTWSNESVQNVRLLGAMAPTCYLEQIAYDTRLFNEAISDGPVAAGFLQRWMVRSDIELDPQALVLAPESAVQIASAIVGSPNPYRAGVAAGLAAIDILSDAFKDKRLRIPEREVCWLDSIQNALYDLPESESEFMTEMMDQVDRSTFRPADYELD